MSSNRRAYPHKRPTVRKAERKQRRWPLVAAVIGVCATFLTGVVGFGMMMQGASGQGGFMFNGFGDVTAERSFAEPEKSEQTPDPQIDPDATNITISFIGDCTLGTDEKFDQSVSFNAYYEKYGPNYFFQNTASIFLEDDLTVANCEGVLTDLTTRDDREYAYKGPPEYANIFAISGVDAAAVSNNHTYDYGWDSRFDTINALEDAGVAAFGYERLAYRDIKGVKVALVGVNMVEQGLWMQYDVVERIERAKAEGAQIIAVYMHWGDMDVYEPTSIQREIARIAIDNGASIVVGSHPHVIQGYEMYKGRYIVYSMGNFSYGGSRGLFDPDCYIFQQTFSVKDNEVLMNDNINVIPCLISSNTSYNDYQPKIVEGAEKARIEAKIAELNIKLATE